MIYDNIIIRMILRDYTITYNRDLYLNQLP